MNRSSFLSLMITVLILSACRTVAPESAYVNANKRVTRVISKVYNIPEDRVIGSRTLAQVGLVPGENDVTLKAALEDEFDILMADDLFKPNKTVSDLSAGIAAYKAISRQAARQQLEWGPLKNQKKSEKTEPVPQQKTP